MTEPASKLAIGTAQFGMSYGIANKNKEFTQANSYKILQYAQNCGINTIDTAKTYNRSEEYIGSFIKNNPKNEYCIITKINNSEIDLTEQIIDTKKKLTIYPNIVLAHSVEDYLNLDFCYKLHKLKDIDGINKVGVSIYSQDDINNVLKTEIPDVIQCPINILDTKLYKNGILDKMREKNIEIHARSIFLQGFFYLSREKQRKLFPQSDSVMKSLNEIAKSHNLSLPELSFLWVLSLNEIDKIIIGIDNVNQLKNHLQTIDKVVNNIIFKDALRIDYDNGLMLNPSKWSFDVP